MIYRTLLRPVLFQLDSETAHNLALSGASVIAHLKPLARLLHALARPASMPIEKLGLTFSHPVGLAGGMDKNGRAPLAWWAFGFGFIELGTVTPRPQSGNAKPRMFRQIAERALINRMGFNNDGATALANRLRDQTRHGLRPPFPVGISVGKNKDTPAEQAIEDFTQAAQIVAPQADFLTVNVSSPNTPGLRALQNADDLGRLVRAVCAASLNRPVLVKVAPELDGEELKASLDAAMSAGAKGVIATNTLGTTAPTGEPAGLSGRPLLERSRQVVHLVRKRVGDSALVIGCGGIDDVTSARAMLDAGADLLQLYTGLVYEGPFLPAVISRRLKALST